MLQSRNKLEDVQVLYDAHIYKETQHLIIKCDCRNTINELNYMVVCKNKCK